MDVWSSEMEVSLVKRTKRCLDTPSARERERKKI